MNPELSELSGFAARLRGTIAHRPAATDPGAAWVSERQFSELALALFALQFQCNPPFRRICEARQRTPGSVEHWTQIPFVPTAAFKELELSCLPLQQRTAVFHSSGTTEQKPSRHFHSPESLALYEASLWAWFATNFQFPSEAAPRRTANCQLLVLTPPALLAPRSSLVYMFETIKQNLGMASVPAGSLPFVGRLDDDGAWGLDFAAVLARLNHHHPCPIGPPLLILGTAFSFVHLLDFLAEQHLRFELPPGSRVLETGGYKNRSRVLPKAELHSLLTEKLGIPPENIHCEYGMSELSSQAYDCPIQPPTSILPPRIFRFPPWARVQIMSPETGREVAEGETGLIRIFDLANVFSIAALQTEDLGIRHSEGFELVGRTPHAEPRGCSLNNLETLKR